MEKLQFWMGHIHRTKDLVWGEFLRFSSRGDVRVHAPTMKNPVVY